MDYLVHCQLVLATITCKFSSCYCFTHITFIVGVWREVEVALASGGEMARCSDVASREIIVLRLVVFFGLYVTHLKFHIRVINCWWIEDHYIRMVRCDNSKIEVVR